MSSWIENKRRGKPMLLFKRVAGKLSSFQRCCNSAFVRKTAKAELQHRRKLESFSNNAFQQQHWLSSSLIFNREREREIFIGYFRQCLSGEMTRLYPMTRMTQWLERPHSTICLFWPLSITNQNGYGWEHIIRHAHCDHITHHIVRPHCRPIVHLNPWNDSFNIVNYGSIERLRSALKICGAQIIELLFGLLVHLGQVPL